MKLPFGAQQIVSLRKRGKRPAEMVLVSFLGPLEGEINPVVMVRDEQYDFRFLHGLDVMLVCDMQTPRRLIKEIADDVMHIRPSYAGIWFKDIGDGVNLCWGQYKATGWMRKWLPSERAAYARH